MKITISLAQQNDIDSMVKLLKSLFEKEHEFKPNEELQRLGLTQILNNEEIGHILLLKKDNVVIGMVSLLYSISTALGGKVSTLEDMIIDSNFRNQGFGSSLLDAAIKFAKDNDSLRITLLTDHDNQEAINLYTKFGFTKSPMIPLRKVF